MEREVHSILGPLGVKETLSRLVAEDLRKVEDSTRGERGGGTEGIMTAQPTRAGGEEKKTGWFKWGKRKTEEEDGGVKGNEEMGMTAFLLKFGEGLGARHPLASRYYESNADVLNSEEVPRSRLYISALTIGLSYFIGGLIPLIPYMAKSSPSEGLIISCIITGVILFIFGGFKTYFT